MGRVDGRGLGRDPGCGRARDNSTRTSSVLGAGVDILARPRKRWPGYVGCFCLAITPGALADLERMNLDLDIRSVLPSIPCPDFAHQESDRRPGG